MLKIEIKWTGEAPDGEKRQVCARIQGDRWMFFTRAKRFDDWEELASPPLEDWLALLDAVRRRGRRHLASPKDEARLLAHIRKVFPGAQFD
jgi:hypothetical protein